MMLSGDIEEFLKNVWYNNEDIPRYLRLHRSLPHHNFDHRIFNRFTENTLFKLSLT